MRIFYYPEFKNNEELNDQVNRASWYLTCLYPSSVTFFSDLSYVYKEREEFSHKLKGIAERNFEEGLFKLKSSGLVCDLDVTGGDVIILWKDRGELDESELSILKRISSVAKVYDVNPSRRMEGSLYIEISREYYGFDSCLVNESKNKFEALKLKHEHVDNSFVFCTGPSISEYKSYVYDSSLKIICNSVINDDEFMDYVKPDILAFADPIFHFGCSSYAQMFRDKLVKSAEVYDFDIVIPIKYYPIFNFYLPELAGRTIPLPYKDIEEFNVDLSKNFVAKTTDNILTFMMLPLAASLSDNVFIIGCDGRPLDEDDYFWKHNNKTQFSGEMESIKLAHPSFFKLEYNEYYLRHCDSVELFFKKGESEGKSFVSLGFSYIPALVCRDYSYKKYTGCDRGELFVSVNPDLRDKFGHFMHYDMRLYEELGEKEDLLSLGNKSVEIESSPFEIKAVFSRNTWNLRSFELTPHYSSFRDELANELRQLSIVSREVCVYIYPGSIQFYALVTELLSVYPELQRINFKINLFYAHMDYSSLHIPSGAGSNYYSSFLSLYEELRRDFDQVQLFSDSRKLKSLLQKDFGVNLRDWPMISVTSIEEVNAFKSSRLNSKSDSNGLKVLFPGTGQLAKGYDLVCELILSYGSQPMLDGKNVTFIIRDQFRDTEQNNSRLREMFKDVEMLPWVDVIHGHLSEKEYFDYFFQADIVLLPYRSNHFRTRTSGCLVDAFNFEKPVVVFSGTWLGDVVEELGCGKLAEDGNVDSIKKSMEILSSSPDFFGGAGDKFSSSSLMEILKNRGKLGGLSILMSSKINTSLAQFYPCRKVSFSQVFAVSAKKSNVGIENRGKIMSSSVKEASQLSRYIFWFANRTSISLNRYPLVHGVLSKVWRKLRVVFG